MEERMNDMKRAAELLQRVVDGDLSPEEAKAQWPKYHKDFMLDLAKDRLDWFEVDAELRTRNREFSTWQISGFKRTISYLTETETKQVAGEPYSLRETLETPLHEIDTSIVSFAKSVGAFVLSDYRDDVNRIIWWRERRVVKYISISSTEYSEDCGKIYYYVAVCAYRISIPLVHFWNAYFQLQGDFRKSVGIIKAPIDPRRLQVLLREAYALLKSITRTDLKRRSAR
jgi:hypothetical protein